jgi:catechol 2,3-dioxygenase-like lactoylglutathione lyase family enzyme
MDIGPVHHVSINVPSVAEVEPFYTEVLGMKTLERPDFGFPGSWLESESGAQVHLIEVDDDEWTPPKGQHWAFKVDDIDAMVGELRSRGVKIRDAREIPGTTARQTFFKDPAGNMIEINQPY